MMDTKEALKELDDLIVDYGNRNEEQIARLDEAIDMAMEALRNLPNRLRQAMDTISRQAAVEACYNGWNKDYRGIAQDIKDLPPAQPEKRTEERTETHACDCISRQAARMCLTGDVTNMSIEQYIKMVDKRLEQLPPSPTLSRQHDISKAKFSCPICGAEMEVTVDEWDEGGAV